MNLRCWPFLVFMLALDAQERRLALPPTLSPGEEITAAILDPVSTPPSGVWSIAGVRARGQTQLRVRLPAELKPGAAIRIEFKAGRSSFQQTALDTAIVAPPELTDLGPRITGCAERVARGNFLCVCGYFPAGSAGGLRVNGAPAEVAAGSLRAVLLRTDTLTPGLLAITGDRQSGFPPDDVRQSQLIQLTAMLDRDSLWRGETTAMRLTVEGTTNPVEVRLQNRTPAVVNLEPYAYQTAWTTGGATNMVERRVHGLRRGDFAIDYTLAGSECPCSDRRERRQVLALVATAGAAAVAAELGAPRALAVVEVAPVPAIGGALIVFDILDGQPPAVKATALLTDSRVLLAQANQTFATVAQSAAGPSGLSPSARLLNAPTADRTQLASVRLALIDSGVDLRHPALEGAVTVMRDFTGREAQADLHGTMLAGILAARGGLAPGVSLSVLKACHPHSPADAEALCSSVALAKALQYAIDERADVINLSLAGPEDAVMRRMIDAALKNRIAVIAAVGNHGPKSPPLYPAAFPGVVGVTAIDDRRSIYAHANRGAYIALAAPGVDLLVPAPGGRQIVASGTSLAAAEVSGLLVLVLARNRQANGLSAAGWLLDTPTDLGARGRDPIFGFGLANGCAALGKGLGKPVPCP